MPTDPCPSRTFFPLLFFPHLNRLILKQHFSCGFPRVFCVAGVLDLRPLTYCISFVALAASAVCRLVSLIALSFPSTFACYLGHIQERGNSELQGRLMNLLRKQGQVRPQHSNCLSRQAGAAKQDIVLVLVLSVVIHQSSYLQGSSYLLNTGFTRCFMLLTLFRLGSQV